MIDLLRYVHRECLVLLAPAPRDAILRKLVQVALTGSAEAPETAPSASLDWPRLLKDQTLGAGFALSHARVPAGDEIRVSVGLLRPPGAFGRWSDIHTIICALIPEQCAREYLSLMARLARVLSTPEAEAAFRSSDPDRILAILRTPPS